MPEFVYNRKQRHLDRLKLLQQKGYANLSTGERQEYHSSAALGAYNHTDLNRVESAVAEIAPMYGLSLTTVTDHTYWSIPVMATDARANMTRYLNNVVAIRDAALAVDSTLEFPELPDSMDYLTWKMANNIEKTLYIAYENASIAAGHTLTWDGNIEGKTVVDGEWVKVSSAVPTIEDFTNGFTLAYSSEDVVTFSPDSVSEQQGGIELDGYTVVIVHEAGAQMYGTEWPETGIYFWYPEGLRSLTIPGYTGFLTPPQKEPVAYLYNGVRLPALPEWDREMYPFAFIQYDSSGESATYLYCVESFKYSETPSIGGMGWGLIVPATSLICKLENGSWGTFRNPSVFGQGVYDYRIHWTNFDMLAKDGSIYIAASEPIPVYE